VDSADTRGEQGAHHASLAEIARLFLRLGTTAFGGPAAHIAMMEDEVVRRRRWLTREAFLDYLGATQFIPGPNSTELAIHIGHARAGWGGLVVAGVSFIVPAMIIATGLAWAYATYGALPEAEALLYGIKPVVIAVVAQALWGLGRTAVKTKGLALLGALAVVAAATGVNELVVLAVASAAAVAAWSAWTWWRRGTVAVVLAVSGTAWGGTATLGAAAASTGTAQGIAFGLWPLFLFFLKVGSVLFGSGYVLLAFLRADLVERFAWLTEQQLLDAVAIGQMVPGPLFTTATFIGHVLGGIPGALVATAGIFLPAFFFVAVSGPLVPKLRRSPAAGAALDGVNVASLALMAVVAWHLGRSALVDLPTLAIAGAGTWLLVRYRTNPVALIAAGAVVGLVVKLLVGFG